MVKNLKRKIWFLDEYFCIKLVIDLWERKREVLGSLELRVRERLSKMKDIDFFLGFFCGRIFM